MSTAKEELTQLVQDQPEDSTLEEIVRELAFRLMVERGLAEHDRVAVALQIRNARGADFEVLIELSPGVGRERLVEVLCDEPDQLAAGDVVAVARGECQVLCWVQPEFVRVRMVHGKGPREWFVVGDPRRPHLGDSVLDVQSPVISPVIRPRVTEKVWR